MEKVRRGERGEMKGWRGCEMVKRGVRGERRKREVIEGSVERDHLKKRRKRGRRRRRKRRRRRRSRRGRKKLRKSNQWSPPPISLISIPPSLPSPHLPSLISPPLPSFSDNTTGVNSVMLLLFVGVK